MTYAEFHNVADGLDVVLYIIIIVGCAWAWFGKRN